MVGCFSGNQRPAPAQAATATEAPEYVSTSTSSGASPPSSASTSSLAFLDDLPPVYLDDEDAAADAVSEARLSFAIASRRFFLASPGRSNSIVDSSEHATATAPSAAAADAEDAVVDGDVKPTDLRVCEAGRAVRTSSPDPHADFLKSMVEMASAMQLDARRGADRARLHELLLWYLALNHPRAHEHVISAFTDLLLTLTAAANDRRD